MRPFFRLTVFHLEFLRLKYSLCTLSGFSDESTEPQHDTLAEATKSKQNTKPNRANANNVGNDGQDIKYEQSMNESKTNSKEWIPSSKYKKEQKRIKKQSISAVFNYSSITLSDVMEKVLNRGLDFSVLPLKLDITQVIVYHKRFERTMIWKEFWHGKYKTNNMENPIFKSKKKTFLKKLKLQMDLRTTLIQLNPN